MASPMHEGGCEGAEDGVDIWLCVSGVDLEGEMIGT